MSEKRRDNRNRILREGEYQRTDGRYRYRYIDEDGKEKNVYSWRLDKNGPTPKGKKREPSLREKEKQIQQDLFNGLAPKGGDLTVQELVEKYLSLKANVRHNTQANYNFVLNIIKKEDFGKMRIGKVKQSDAKAWLIELQKDGRGYSTIHSVRGVVRPAFEMALQDDLIRKNPFQFELATVVVNDSVTREAITRAQEKAFLTFIQKDACYSKYYDGIYILFHTGLRVSEFCGLTVSDIDFKNKRIRVDHQLQRTRGMEYIIEDTKTKNGERFVPMSAEVMACFRRIIANRKKPSKEPMIDGYTGFLFLDKNEMPEDIPKTKKHENAENISNIGHLRRNTRLIWRYKTMIKILFVCHGNICRSPMAQYVFQDMVNKAGVAQKFHIASCATSREELGNPVYPPARRELNSHGIRCDGHRARQITRKDLEEYDYIYYMDSNNRRNLNRMFPDFQDFRPFLSRDVADPWYSGDFTQTWLDVQEGCKRILEELA